MCMQLYKLQHMVALYVIISLRAFLKWKVYIETSQQNDIQRHGKHTTYMAARLYNVIMVHSY